MHAFDTLIPTPIQSFKKNLLIVPAEAQSIEQFF